MKIDKIINNNIVSAIEGMEKKSLSWAGDWDLE